MRTLRTRAVVLALIVGLFGLSACGSPTSNSVTNGGSSPTASASRSTATSDGPAATSAAVPRSFASKYNLAADTKTEFRGSFNYLWKEANQDPSSPGYGLVADRAPGNPGLSSNAATGFALAGIPVGVNAGWVTTQAGEERARGALKSVLAQEQSSGWLYHFVDQSTGKPSPGSEVSSIDTGLLLAGAITAGQYFGGEVAELARELYERVDWPFFLDTKRNQFRMAYDPGTGEFSGYWDYYAEQLVLYILAAGSPTHPLDGTQFYSFTRASGTYQDATKPYIYSWFGSLFTHQYSHAFIDFRGLVDNKGVDWYANSVNATIDSRAFGISLHDKFPIYSRVGWGLTASDSSHGYDGLFGSPPAGAGEEAVISKVDGTLMPAGAIGSYPFLPDKVAATVAHYYTIPGLAGPYGLRDAFSMTADGKYWIGPDDIGIDKGINTLMIANYQSGMISKLFMSSPAIAKGLATCGLRKA